MSTRQNLGTTFSDFSKKWAGGSTLLIEENLGWEALGYLEHLWPEMIEKAITGQMKGGTFAAELVDAGLVLQSTYNINGFEEILNRLKAEETSAFRELVIASLLMKSGLKIELEPELNNRKPDFGFVFNGEYIYVETITPNSSDFHKKTEEFLMALGYHLVSKQRNNAIEITLLDEPSPDLFRMIVSLDEQIDVNPSFNSVYSYINRIEWKYLQPQLSQGSIRIKNSQNQTNLGMFFTEPNRGTHVGTHYLMDEPERVGKLIDQEIKHFSKEHINLLIVDTKNDSLSVDVKTAIERRFQPTINRRLSGVLVLSEFYTIIGGVKMQREWRVFPNPHAYKPLSNLLLQFLGDLGNYQLW